MTLISPPADGIWLSPTIAQLKRAAAEKILLAHLCQQAAHNNGVCADTNKDLGQAMGMHPQTVSDLVSRLKEARLLADRTDIDVVSGRVLTPPADVLADYPRLAATPEPITYPLSQSLTPLSHLLTPSERIAQTPKPITYPPPPMTDSPSASALDQSPRPHRLCPVTGIDITHQRADCLVVTTTTLRAFFRQDQPRFDALVAQLLSPQQASESLSSRCYYLSQLAHKRLKAAPHATGLPTTQPPSVVQRLCPVTGVDITHQPADHKVVTRATLHALFLSDRARFDDLVSRFLTPEQAKLPTSGRCMQLNLNARKLAKIPSNENDTVKRAPKLNERLCPITGIDIGQQRTDVRYVSAQTLERLARKQTPVYVALAAWLLPDETPDLNYPGSQCRRMADFVREVASSGLPITPPELPLRRCPVTGIDLSQQSPNYTLVTASTLRKLYDADRPQFEEVAARFLTPDELVESRKGQCQTLVIRIQQSQASV